MWLALSIIAGVALVCFSRNRNAVWGSVTLGMIGGLISAAIYYFKGAGFNWRIVGKWIVVCVLAAVVIEGVAKILNKNKRP